MDIHGVGAVVAARILADVGDIARFADRNRFASWTGTAPLDASSGEQNRHRLSRAGNRRINHMIHIAAVTQIRLDTDGRAYYRRKRVAGKKPMEAMRCLKRKLSDAIYRQLVADAQRAALTASLEPVGAGPGGHCGASQNPARSTAPAYRHFGSATSRTRSNDATTSLTLREEPRATAPQDCRLTTEGSRNDALDAE